MSAGKTAHRPRRPRWTTRRWNDSGRKWISPVDRRRAGRGRRKERQRVRAVRADGQMVKAHRWRTSCATGEDIRATWNWIIVVAGICVKPAHLEPVSNAENVARGAKGFALTGLCAAGLHGRPRSRRLRERERRTACAANATASATATDMAPSGGARARRADRGGREGGDRRASSRWISSRWRHDGPGGWRSGVLGQEDDPRSHALTIQSRAAAGLVEVVRGPRTRRTGSRQRLAVTAFVPESFFFCFATSQSSWRRRSSPVLRSACHRWRPRAHSTLSRDELRQRSQAAGRGEADGHDVDHV